VHDFYASADLGSAVEILESKHRRGPALDRTVSRSTSLSKYLDGRSSIARPLAVSDGFLRLGDVISFQLPANHRPVALGQGAAATAPIAALRAMNTQYAWQLQK
jgi:hypothetical protein